jgi:hypothetical protein
MVMSPVRLGTKENCAGECQHQFSSHSGFKRQYITINGNSQNSTLQLENIGLVAGYCSNKRGLIVFTLWQV